MLPFPERLVRFRRRRVRGALAMLGALTLALPAIVASSGPATASVGSDQAQIAELEQQIAAQGTHVESLVGHYNEVQARVGALDLQIAQGHLAVAADARAERAAAAVLQRMAVDAYVSVGAQSPTLMLFANTGSVTTTLEEHAYLGVVNTKWSDALTALHLHQARTEEAQHSLRSEQANAKATLRLLAAAHDAATSAIASDETLLSRVRGNLRSVLAAANAKREADELAEERALATAAQAAQAQPPSIPPPSSPTSPTSTPLPALPSPPPRSGSSPSPTPGTYANPLRAMSALSSERIDQGVDFGGFGPIYAVGDGVVLSTTIAGWPGGTFIAYQLTDGPAAGLVVYAAEDIEPAVQIGATVTSSTVLGQAYAGPTGIETGWADGAALGNTMARTYQQFHGSNSTAFGANFSELLQSLGAPGGILQNNPPTGTLPAAWPHW